MSNFSLHKARTLFESLALFAIVQCISTESSFWLIQTAGQTCHLDDVENEDRGSSDVAQLASDHNAK